MDAREQRPPKQNRGTVNELDRGAGVVTRARHCGRRAAAVVSNLDTVAQAGRAMHRDVGSPNRRPASNNPMNAALCAGTTAPCTSDAPLGSAAHLRSGGHEPLPSRDQLSPSARAGCASRGRVRVPLRKSHHCDSGLSLSGESAGAAGVTASMLVTFLRCAPLLPGSMSHRMARSWCCGSGVSSLCPVASEVSVTGSVVAGLLRWACCDELHGEAVVAVVAGVFCLSVEGDEFFVLRVVHDVQNDRPGVLACRRTRELLRDVRQDCLST